MENEDRPRWRTLGLTSLGHFVNDGNLFFVPVVADMLATEKGVPILTVTLMSVAFYTSSALFSVFVGRWADRSGSLAKLIGVGLGLLSAGLIGFYAAQSLESGELLAVLVILSAIVAGFGSAFYHPLAATVLQGAYLSRSKGKVLGVNGAAGVLGSGVYPPLFFYAAILLSRGSAFILLALLGFVASGIIAIGLRERRTTSPEGPGTQRSTNASEALTRGIIILTIVTAVRSISTTGVYFWLPTYITTQKGAGIGPLLGLTLGVMYATAIPGMLFFGALTDRFDKRLVLALGAAGSTLCTVGYIFTGGGAALAFISLFGFFSFTNFPILLALASEYVPATSSSLGGALVWGLGTTGGSVIGPAVVGLMVGGNLAQLSMGFELMAAMGMVGALVAPLMPRPGMANKPSLME